MATVSQVLFLKPQPGRLEAMMRDLARAKGIVTRAGGNFRAWNEMSGVNAGAIAVVVEHADWKDFGSYMAKLEADKDYQAFIAELNARKDPNTVRLAAGINVEVPS
ncbi:MAG TPA: hypothetical protein VEF03_12000 [Candidatus Binataceae bacterium]|nr:hypothetical protein [Candidatus Binataceae bacterium]